MAKFVFSTSVQYIRRHPDLPENYFLLKYWNKITTFNVFVILISYIFGKVGRNYFKFGDSNQHPILQRDVFASPFLLIREKKYVISRCDLTFLLSKLHTSLFVISFLPIFCRKHLVFCYQNCSDPLWEKIVLVIEKNFWNSRLKADNLQKFWDH